MPPTTIKTSSSDSESFPTIKNSSSDSESLPEWSIVLLVGLAILIFIGILIILFFVGKHFYQKRKKSSASKKIQKLPIMSKEKLLPSKGSTQKDSTQYIKSQTRQQPSSTQQQCSSSAPAAEEGAKKKKSNEKVRRKSSIKEPPLSSSIKETTAEEGNEPPSLKNTIDEQQKQDEIKEFSAKGGEEDENEEPIDIKNLNEAEKDAEKKIKQNLDKKDVVQTEEVIEAVKKKQEKFAKDKIDCDQKVKKMFETPEWDKKHMPPDCDLKLFMAPSAIERFCIMEYLKAHADQILIAHDYKIAEGRAEVPRTAFEWLRSTEITGDDEFLKSRAWMLENWSIFKRSPNYEWEYYCDMEIPLLYMTSMKDCITEPEILDKVLRKILQKSKEYFAATEKKDWQLKDHPMKVMAKIFEEGKSMDLAAASTSVNTTTTENVEVKDVL
uniref:Uncharacterized protein n=1 Tax=Panagrolaimus sp. PS1159 TaxID=55785 RepID=A0AC35FBI8_9BILA